MACDKTINSRDDALIEADVAVNEVFETKEVEGTRKKSRKDAKQRELQEMEQNQDNPPSSATTAPRPKKKEKIGEKVNGVIEEEPVEKIRNNVRRTLIHEIRVSSTCNTNSEPKRDISDDELQKMLKCLTNGNYAKFMRGVYQNKFPRWMGMAEGDFKGMCRHYGKLPSIERIRQYLNIWQGSNVHSIIGYTVLPYTHL